MTAVTGQYEYCTVCDIETVELGLPNSLGLIMEWWALMKYARVAKTKAPGCRAQSKPEQVSK